MNWLLAYFYPKNQVFSSQLAITMKPFFYSCTFKKKPCADKASLVCTKACANLVRKPCARGLCGALCGGFVRWAFAKLVVEGEWVLWLGGTHP